MNPIFIFSLPRSGSTLLQRMFMGHSKISSVAEPHILLPLTYALKKETVLSLHNHYNTYNGCVDFVNNLPNKTDDYYSFLGEFVIKLYSSVADVNTVYFIDKTPKYFWIIPEINKIFPHARFIFLFRNPLQICASMITTFDNNSFKRFSYMLSETQEGFGLLSKGYELIKDKSVAVNYEELVSEPNKSIEKILSYLDLKYEKQIIDKIQDQNLKGKKGDPTGIKNYNKIETASLDKWKEVFNSGFRKKIIYEFINKLSFQDCIIQGYNKNLILEDLENLNTNGKYSNIKDFIDFNKSKLVKRFKLNLFFSKNMKWTKNKYFS